MVPISLHIGILESCPSSPSHVFPGTGPKWRSKKIMVHLECLGCHSIYFHICTSPGFTKDLSWWFGTPKKKVAEQIFFLCHPQSNNNKMDAYFSWGPQRSPRALPWLGGICGPGRALLSEGTRCSGSMHCHRCVTTGKPRPLNCSFFIWKMPVILLPCRVITACKSPGKYV